MTAKDALEMTTEPHERTPPAGEISVLARKYLQEAVTRAASDVHLNRLADGVIIRYRVNGVLQDVDTLDVKRGKRLIHHLKAISGMDIIERRRPQDGRVLIGMEGGEIDFRLSTIDTLWGENMAIRIFDKRGALTDLKQLGMERTTYQTLFELSTPRRNCSW